MKPDNLLKYTIVLALITFVNSCKEENDKLGESILTNTMPYPQNNTDFWLKQNFETPYNIDVLYRWEAQYVDYNRYLFPPTTKNVQPAMEIVKKLWIDTYSAIGGKNFVKTIAPKEIVLIGGVNKNKTGTTTLGIAEAGARITIFQTDNLIAYIKDPANSLDQKRSFVRSFIHTIQHEYIHILNQAKPYDRKAYQAIVKNGRLGQYKSDWYSDTDAIAREKGYITAYAQSNVDEDIAEMASYMLVYSKKEYEDTVNAIGKDPLDEGKDNQQARALIRAKEKLIVAYFKEQFNINFYDLAEEANKNSEQVFNSFNK